MLHWCDVLGANQAPPDQNLFTRFLPTSRQTHVKTLLTCFPRCCAASAPWGLQGWGPGAPRWAQQRAAAALGCTGWLAPLHPIPYFVSRCGHHNFKHHHAYCYSTMHGVANSPTPINTQCLSIAIMSILLAISARDDLWGPGGGVMGGGAVGQTCS